MTFLLREGADQVVADLDLIPRLEFGAIYHGRPVDVDLVGLVEPLENPAGLAQRIDHRVLIGDAGVRQLDPATFARADVDGLLAAGYLPDHRTVLENDQAHVVLLNSQPPPGRTRSSGLAEAQPGRSSAADRQRGPAHHRPACLQPLMLAGS